MSLAKFVRLCEGIETRDVIDRLFAEAAQKGVHPRVVAGVRWGLFSEEGGRLLLSPQLNSITDRFVQTKRKELGIRLVQKKSKVNRSRGVGTGLLGSNVASALRYMAAQRDSMSD